MSFNGYKRLGDYIRQVDVRNKDLAVTQLVGISINKNFIPSVANVIDTDLSNYKVIKRNQYACNLMHVDRDEVVPIAMYNNSYVSIVSPAYPVFEVIEPSIILPKYLMMCFRHNEFDRRASYFSGTGIRGGLNWEDFCNIKVPIPPIDYQREIVQRYEMLSCRISLNKTIIDKLEEVAQTLYRKYFIDGIDRNHLPYGWKMGSLVDIAEYMNGTACQNYPAQSDNNIPVLKIRELTQGYCDEQSDKVSHIPTKYIIQDRDVVFSWSATLFISIWCGGECALNQHLFKVTTTKYPIWFAFLSTQYHIEGWKRLISAKATSMGHIKREDLEKAEVAIPPKEYFVKRDSLFTKIFELQYILGKENKKLSILQTLLLSEANKT